MSILAIEPPKLDSMTARQKSLAFFTLIVALVLEIVDITIVNTALPMIQRDFSGGAAQAQWVVAGYSLSFAILLILLGSGFLLWQTWRGDAADRTLNLILGATLPLVIVAFVIVNSRKRQKKQ